MTADPALPLPAASVATAAGIETVTTPGPSGTRVKAYAALPPENPATVALVTTTALASKPITGSLKTTLIGIGETLVGSDAVEAIATVGAVRSAAAVICPPLPTVCVVPPIVAVTVPARTENRIWSSRFVP
jgi:hypothetical protein